MINQVDKWWTENLTGQTKKMNDEFSVQFADVHYSKQRIVEWVPNEKMVWSVIDSRLNWLTDKTEWTGTQIAFELKTQGNQTILKVTHFGLVPEVACYENCTKGWDYFIGQSLYKLLTEGKGMPERKVKSEYTKE